MSRRRLLVVVIGGAHSNNTKELVTACGLHCSWVYHVQSAAQLRSVWFRSSDRAAGITAGTSTPDYVIEEVEAWLNDFVRFQQQLESRIIHPAHELVNLLPTEPG